MATISPVNTTRRASWGRYGLLPGVRQLILAAILTGCASAPPPAPPEPPVFPPPPNEPRFIYERTLRYDSDVEKPTGFERFKQMATGEGREPQGLVKPYGVAARHGRVYVTDTAQRLVNVFDIADGRFFQFGMEEPGKLEKPVGIALAASGEAYVADTTARRVAAFDANGRFLRFIGEGALRIPSGVAVSPAGNRLYVVDTGGVDSQEHHVRVFDPHSGELLQTIGARGEKEGEFNLPLQAAVAGDGTLYVVDSGNFRVQAFNPDGGFKSVFGGVGRFPGQFARPKGIAVDGDGNIYVTDTAFGNFQIFTPQGELLMFAGNRGTSGMPGKFSLPAGIAVDENGWVYVADQYFRKVEIFRPLTKNSE